MLSQLLSAPVNRGLIVWREDRFSLPVTEREGELCTIAGLPRDAPLIPGIAITERPI